MASPPRRWVREFINMPNREFADGVGKNGLFRLQKDIKMKSLFFTLLVTSTLFLVSCTNSAGDVFVGEWESGSLCNAPDIIQITKQDSNYFVDMPGKGKFPATYENNLLNSSRVTIGYEKTGDKIIFYPSKAESFRRTEEYLKAKDLKRKEMVDVKENIKGNWVLESASSKASTYPILGSDLFVRNSVEIIIEKAEYKNIYYEYKFSNDSKKLIIKQESFKPDEFSEEVFNIDLQRCYLYLSPEGNEKDTSQWVPRQE